MYKERLKIPENHNLVQTSSKNEQRKGRDTDIYDFDELNEDNEVIAKYVVRDSISIYPPQTTTITYVKYDLSGSEIESGSL